ncbi:MAG: mechanosensitive ion channel family protein [Eubacteriales bacterium]|nr:mechanosensitive ion channel family protein [Eubacteriales bacterium]
MEKFLSFITELATTIGTRILFAAILLLVGRLIIKNVVRLLRGNHLFDKTDAAVRSFTLSFVEIGLYVLLVISVIGILGVPMASVVAALASASVAIGLALQGALANLAGGIMLLLFRPFQIGDYIDAAGVSGTAKEITFFYTVLVTFDNKYVTIPNGTLMNANVVNYSTAPVRRVDLNFSCARGESPSKLQDILLEAAFANEKVLDEPEPPFACITGITDEAMQFSLRIWCQNEYYWTVYFDLNQKIIEALTKNGVHAPAVRVTTEAR